MHLDGDSSRILFSRFDSVLLIMVLVVVIIPETFKWQSGLQHTLIFNFFQLGQKLGQAIVKLSKAGFPLPSLHLLGYSLGAHLMGYAGTEVKNNGLLISRYKCYLIVLLETNQV